MANSKIQIEIENWIRTNSLPEMYHQRFFPMHLRLETGGYFDFDAVSEDSSIVANISTSNSVTASGKNASAKIQKLRSDMLFLIMTTVKTRLIVLTEKDMYDFCSQEKLNGRVPSGIDFVHVEIPSALKELLQKAKKSASEEVSPKK